ncbi:PP2C family protein-serine/threonine phosphatase [Arenivirga flava]|uniref:Serine/threonine protein phosphatase n=1 Tax=Arenivirga flava TaxID=1930060 RepID=A0AA37XCN6_9MICO|nr:protein phosphatase 2C domain-containing protein [Arenivirga flava]GMA28532.1 serine/threonine protein phosphatase [Arenivirga flava]
MTAVGTVRLAVGALTDTGVQRTNNEDAFLAESPVFIVADGMGGYEAGEVASAAVVDAFRRHASGPVMPSLQQVRDAVIAANADVAAIAAGHARGAGSTLTGIVLVEHDGAPHWLVLNIGDSRVYRHHGSDLDQVTVDHSLGQELIEQGALRREDLPTFAQRNVITRAIGAADSTADSWLLPVINGERMLVCSDGLTGEVADEGIRMTLTMSGRPESAAQALVERAKANGGRDNITVVIVDVLEGGAVLSSDETTNSLLRSAPLDGHDTELVDDTIPVRVR